MIKPCRETLTILALFLLAEVFCSALEIRLEYVPVKSEGRKYQPTGYGALNQKMTEPPPGEWKFPAFVSKTPIFSMIKIGETERLFALDMKSASDNFYNRLYYDSNNNRDLTDDPVIDAEHSPYFNPNYSIARFPGIDTTYSLKGKTLPYRFQLNINFSSPPNIKPEERFSRENINQRFHMYYRSYGYYSGKFNLDGQQYFIYVCDENGNGVFNEAVSIPDASQINYQYPYPIQPTGDSISVSANENITWLDRYNFPHKIMLKDKLYDFSLHETEMKLAINPCAELLIPVSFPLDIEKCNIYRKDGKCGIAVVSSQRDVKISKGEYICLSYIAVKKDEMGNSWRLQAGASKDTPWLIVDGAESHKFLIGEPYSTFTAIPEWALNNFKNSNAPISQVQLYFNLEGAGRELVTSLDMLSGAKSNIPVSSRYNTRPEEPRYIITKADGSIAAEGRFEYG